jgi:hypothetical protein
MGKSEMGMRMKMVMERKRKWKIRIGENVERVFRMWRERGIDDGAFSEGRD